MRTLIIDEQAMKDVQRLKENGLKFLVSKERLASTLKKDAPPVGDYGRHTAYFKTGFRVVYSVEDQPIGTCAHLSISVDAPGKLPTIVAVEQIMDLFDMGHDVYDCVNVWIEEDHAINVLRKMK